LLLLQVIHALVPQAETSVAARYPFQVEQATRLGAAHILYPQDGYQAVQRVTGAQLYQGPMGNQMLLGGYDVIYDTIGKERSIHEALRWTRAGGAVVVVGVSLHLMHLDLTPVWYQEVDLIGTLAHGTETWPVGTQSRRSTFAIATEMILRGQLNPAQLITHRFPLSEYQRALITATDKADCRAIKVVFDYSLQPASVVPNVRTSSQRRLQTPALSDVPEPNVAGDTPGADVTEATDDKTVVVAKPPKRYPLKPGDRTVNG
jgi:L-iditol 2-dehydrogenase